MTSDALPPDRRASRERLLEMERRLAPAQPYVLGVMLPLMVTALVIDGWGAVGMLIQPLVYGYASTHLVDSRNPERLVGSAIVAGQLGFGLTVALTGGPTSPYLPLLVVTALAVAPRFGARALVTGTLLTLLIMVVATVPVDPRGFLDAPILLLASCGVTVLIAAFANILASAELEHRADAVLDPLTGLLNRKALATRFEEVTAQAARTGEPVAVVALDLDGFKAVNDTQGHDRGDEVLRRVAATMRGSLRSFELAYRLGGDEFLVLLPGVEPADACRTAERLRQAIAAEVEGITASFGVAAAAGEQVGPGLAAEADRALYAAKDLGRDRVVPAPELEPVGGAPLSPASLATA